MNDFFKKRYHIAVFCLFLALEAAILVNVTHYGDDYYYMTFSDGGFGNFIGLNVSHYLNVNGRAVVHLADELLLADKSLWLWRVFELFVIGAVVYILALISAGENRKSNAFPLSLAACCFLFSSINVKASNQTFYWATGSMNYVFPIPILLSYYLMYKKFSKTKELPRAATALAFFSCALIEQCAFAALVVTVLIIYTYVLNKKRADVNLILCVLFSAAGFAFLFFAPGNFVRQTYYPEFYSMPLYKRIISNIKPLCGLIFSEWGAADVIAAYLSSSGIKRLVCRKRTWVFAAIEFAAAACTLIYAHIAATAAAAVAAVVLTSVSFTVNIVSAFFEFRRGDADEFFFTLMPVVLQAAMLTSPIFGGRTVLISALMIFVPTVKNIQKITTAEALRRAPTMPSKAATALVLAVIAAALSARQAHIIYGYAENHKIQVYNMENVRLCRENGDKEMTFFVLPNADCRYTLAYDSSYHEYWFKTAFGLPADTVFVYEKAP